MSEGNPNHAAGPSRAVASLATKKPTGTGQKLKFVPTLPARRKKDEVKQEQAAPSAPATSERGRGRGRGRGDGARGGRGRGAAAARTPAAPMIASGPFAMGPSGAGSSGWRSSAPRAAATPVVPAGGPRPTVNLTQSAPPPLKRERPSREGVPKDEDEEVEVYSDPDEGVEIVDMQDVRTMDWMAPDALKKEKERKKKKKASKAADEKPVNEEMEVDRGSAPSVLNEAAEVDTMNAIDLSESEEEEEMEDFVDDFVAASLPGEEDLDLRQERLFLFQFPSPFPHFTSNSATAPENNVPPADPKGKAPEKHVSFAQGTKPDTSTTAAESEEKRPEYIDGVIGQLEMYRSGAVKMRLANGILLDITPGTQVSFLQQAVHIDPSSKQLHVLGEISRRFVATPDIETLLAAMDQADATSSTSNVPTELQDLIPMDTT